MTLLEATGYLASALVVIAFCMKDIVSLRIVAIASNLAFLTYGIGLSLPRSGCYMRRCCRSMPGGFGQALARQSKIEANALKWFPKKAPSHAGS